MDSYPSPHLEIISFLNSHNNLAVPLTTASSLYLGLHLVLLRVYLLVNCKPFQGRELYFTSLCILV